MTDELVKRLRSMHWCVTTETNGVGVSDRKVALEAADRIEALTVERDRLRGALALADAALSGANMNMAVVQKKVKFALANTATEETNERA